MNFVSEYLCIYCILCLLLLCTTIEQTNNQTNKHELMRRVLIIVIQKWDEEPFLFGCIYCILSSPVIAYSVVLFMYFIKTNYSEISKHDFF